MRGIVTLALFLALIACAPTPMVGAGSASSRDDVVVTLDAAEATYAVASLTGQALAKQGLIPDEKRRVLDERAYAALLALRALSAAIRAGSAPPTDLTGAVVALDAAAGALADP